MKILIIGGTGMLGHKMIQVLSGKFEMATIIRDRTKKLEKLGFNKLTKIYDEINVADIDKVERVLKEYKADVVVNAVGIIKQIPSAKDTDLTININSIFPKNLSLLSDKYGYRLITISTDCVFSGKKGNYTEPDICDANDLYGKSKYLGEINKNNCLTLRTSIIGRELFTQHSLIEWFLSNNGGTVEGYKNAFYTGFPTIVFAGIISNIIENFPDLQGLFHVSSNTINKFDLLNLVREKFNLNIAIEENRDFYMDRSLISEKFRQKTGFEPLTWESMIEAMADDPTPYDKWKNQK